MQPLTIVAHNGAALFGGAEKATALLLRGLQQRGHRVSIYCRDDERAARFADYGLQARVFSIGGDASILGIPRFAGRLRTDAPDALLLTTYKKLFLAGAAAQRARVPRVIARIGLSTDVLRSLKYRVAMQRWVDVAVTNSTDTAATLRRQIPDGARARVTCIPNGVPAPTFSRTRAEMRAQIGVPQDAFVIGTLARLVEQKRVDRLLEVLSLLGPDTHCIIAGDGELRYALQEQAQRARLASRVHWLLERSDTADVLNALDAFVLTSDREGLSNAMLEALSCRLPVVSTDVSGARDALSDGAGIITSFAPAGIAAAVDRVRLDDSLREQMRERALQTWRAKFSFEMMLDRWEDVLSMDRRSQRSD